MIWAAAGMGALQLGLTDTQTLGSAATNVVGIVAKDMLGTGMKLRNLDRTEMDARNEAMKSVLVPSRPEKK